MFSCSGVHFLNNGTDARMLARSVCVVAWSSIVSGRPGDSSPSAWPSKETTVRASHERTRARSIGGLYGFAR